jgi:16S rRNA (guanine527-N7)-methyltransferase
VTGRDGALARVLERARALGFLGPGPVRPHLDHARALGGVVRAALGRYPAQVADLGSGGGLPGLVLAEMWPDAAVVLFESMRRRAAHLRQAVAELGCADRVRVVEGRAESAAHDPVHRERYDAAVARSFAAPAPTAEIAAGLVAPGGVLVVSEPPAPEPARWPPDPLAALGFGPAALAAAPAGTHFAVLRKMSAAPDRYPRRPGMPGKRPLW